MRFSARRDSRSCRARLDEPEEQKPVGEPAPVGPRKPEKLLGIGIAFVPAETPAAREEPLVDQPEMLELFDGESTHPAHQLVVIRVGHDERERGCRRFLLAMRVIVEERVEVGRRDLYPGARCSRSEHEPIGITERLSLSFQL